MPNASRSLAARAVAEPTVPSETGVLNSSAIALAVRFFDRYWPRVKVDDDRLDLGAVGHWGVHGIGCVGGGHGAAAAFAGHQLVFDDPDVDRG